MSRRKRKNRSTSIVGTSILAGAGSLAVSRVGQSSVPLANISKSFPAFGTLKGLEVLARSTRLIVPPQRKRKR